MGQYKLVVDTASMPLSGDGGQVAQLSPNPFFGIPGNTTVTVNLTPSGGLVQYFPIQVPAYHTGLLHVSGSPAVEDLTLFDAQGIALAESYSSTMDFTVPDGPQMVYLRALTVFVPTMTVSIAVSPPSLQYPSLPATSALLSTNPQGDGTASGTLAQQGAVQAYTFYAGPGPLRISVTPDAPGDVAELGSLQRHILGHLQQHEALGIQFHRPERFRSVHHPGNIASARPPTTTLFPQLRLCRRRSRPQFA